MPLIRVVRRMGRPPATPLLASFGPGSGTLGRAPDCTLALPDEDRHISRRQARIDVAAGGASITGLSAGNPLIINGHELRQGETRPLVHGDSLHIAEYEMRFEDTWEQSRASGGPGLADDPFADPFANPFADPLPGSSSADPLGRSSTDPSADPFADAPPGAPLIPEGFDPFAEPAAQPHGPGGGADPRGGSDPLGMGLVADPLSQLAGGRADSIDALFDLKPGMDPLGPDSPLGRPLGDKPHAGDSAAADRAGDPVPDNASVLSGSFRLPQPIPATGFDPPEAPVLSWKDAKAAPMAGSSFGPAGKSPGPAVAPVSVRIAPPVASPAASPIASPAALPIASREPPTDLLQALLLGLGFAELPRVAGEGGASAQPLTPELMQRLGELLATACDGTVELLQSRATLKQALRADVTMIQAQDNNPLKFAPDGHSALAQLLEPNPVRGFMEPQRAMRDAYDDLLAHQIGFVAGMRAAMQGIVGRFDPAVLETRLAGRSMLDAMVPTARKARLWELFNSLYADVAREAEDDFQRLFGRAFVQAYEEQVARLERSHPPASGGAGPSA